MKYRFSIFLSSILFITACATVASAQKARMIENDVAIRDAEIIRIPRYQFEYGNWERYRRGDFDNLRLTILEADKYILSRTYVDEHRNVAGSYGIMPIFVFHYHLRFNGVMLNEKEINTLRDIQQGDTIRVESRMALLEHEADEFNEYLGEFMSLPPIRQPEFFFWITRTKNKRKDVIRIVDTGDIEGYKVLYWEIPYKTYSELFW